MRRVLLLLSLPLVCEAVALDLLVGILGALAIAGHHVQRHVAALFPEAIIDQVLVQVDPQRPLGRNFARIF